ncbi:MAG: rhomboid family intramembrane serine protease [Gemmatales bacterium]
MGYQDREYFRDTHSPYFDLIRSTRVCWGLVIIIALVYLATLFTQDTAEPLGEYLKLDPAVMFEGWQWQRLLTAVFVADRPWHMAFALILIWLIGHELEQLVGSWEFLAFFLVATILSNLAVTLVYYYVMPNHGLRFGMDVSCFGPAGPAMALMAWAVFMSPSRVASYLFVPMPMWIVGLLVLVFDLFFFMQNQPMAVKLAVHILSIPFAAAYYFFNWRLTGWRRTNRGLPAQRQLSGVLQFPAKRNGASADDRPSPTPSSHLARSVDEQLEAKLDAVLEKVSASGMQSLTDEEKNILKKASEVMKRRKG